jgi:hypothetical protein
VAGLLRLPRVRRLILVAALIQGRHAMQVRFAVLRCTAAGIGATTAGLLWAESVAGEVAVFPARPIPPALALASNRLRCERLKPINVVQVAAKLTTVSAPMRRRMYFLGATKSRRRLQTA